MLLFSNCFKTCNVFSSGCVKLPFLIISQQNRTSCHWHVYMSTKMLRLISHDTWIYSNCTNTPKHSRSPSPSLGHLWMAATAKVCNFWQFHVPIKGHHTHQKPPSFFPFFSFFHKPSRKPKKPPSSLRWQAESSQCSNTNNFRPSHSQIFKKPQS